MIDLKLNGKMVMLYRVMRASIHLSASDLYPSSYNILETLSYEKNRSTTHLAAVLHTISIFVIYVFFCMRGPNRRSVFDLGTKICFRPVLLPFHLF